MNYFVNAVRCTLRAVSEKWIFGSLMLAFAFNASTSAVVAQGVALDASMNPVEQKTSQETGIDCADCETEDPELLNLLNVTGKDRSRPEYAGLPSASSAGNGSTGIVDNTADLGTQVESIGGTVLAVPELVAPVMPALGIQ